MIIQYISCIKKSITFKVIHIVVFITINAGNGLINNKLSGVQSREESPPGNLFVCQQMIWQPCNTKCGNPVDRTVSKLLPFDFQCHKTQIRTPKSCFYHVYYESYGEIRKFGNPAIRYLATLQSGGFEIAPIRFPMPENILVN